MSDGGGASKSSGAKVTRSADAPAVNGTHAWTTEEAPRALYRGPRKPLLAGVLSHGDRDVYIGLALGAMVTLVIHGIASVRAETALFDMLHYVHDTEKDMHDYFWATYEIEPQTVDKKEEPPPEPPPPPEVKEVGASSRSRHSIKPDDPYKGRAAAHEDRRGAASADTRRRPVRRRRYRQQSECNGPPSRRGNGKAQRHDASGASSLVERHSRASGCGATERRSLEATDDRGRLGVELPLPARSRCRRTRQRRRDDRRHRAPRRNPRLGRRDRRSGLRVRPRGEAMCARSPLRSGARSRGQRDDDDDPANPRALLALERQTVRVFQRPRRKRTVPIIDWSE